MKDLRIVIPAYNEENAIGDVIDRVKVSCPDADFIIVNDASSDRTVQIAIDRGIKVISNPVNLGYGGALKVGFNHFTDTGDYIKYLAFLDADGTYPPEKIPELYNLCVNNGYDMVVGSRLISRNKGMPFIRMVGNSLFAFLATTYSGRKVTDTGSGLRVFKKELSSWVQELPDGLDLTPAMTIKALFEGLAYAEIAIEYNKRIGRSKLSNLRDGYRFLRVIMKATRQHRPWLFYCTLGIPFLLVDLLVKLGSVLRARDG